MTIKNLILTVFLPAILLTTVLLESVNSVTPENKNISFSIFDANVKAFPVASPPQLPDVSGYTIEAVRKKIPTPASFRVSIKKIYSLPASFYGVSDH